MKSKSKKEIYSSMNQNTKHLIISLEIPEISRNQYSFEKKILKNDKLRFLPAYNLIQQCQLP